MSITSSQLRSKYLAFFTAKGHVVIPSASLVPANDPTVLFTTAGMHPLVPNLLGEPHPAGARLVNVQKCVRTGDIDVIGDTTHLTFFEMLGNWSLGDYFRDEAIRWSFEFLTEPEWLGLALDRLGVTCFAGDDAVPRDTASVALWTALGIAPERIELLGREHNWWGPAGKTGPCGPDTEIFYWTGEGPAPRVLETSDARWVEIWNNVFMGFTQSASGAIEPLPRVNVDTGMGLERTLVALNGMRTVYDVDTVAPIVRELRALGIGEAHLPIVTDHLRAACFMLGDGVGPSNKDRGYVVRRLLRRCMLFAQHVDWIERGVASVLDVYRDAYPELGAQRDAIIAAIRDERVRFDRTVAQGMKALCEVTHLDGTVAFDLFQKLGIPFELTLELAQRTGKTIDLDDFEAAARSHRERSRSTSRGAFEGGLADHSVEIVRYHTLTHLLQAALREVIGPHVIQRGSNITRDRLRFDFPHDHKLAPEELARVEALVNGWIAHDLRVDRATMTEAEARAQGALGAFGEKYGDVVSVYTVSDPAGTVISRELCGGPHVTSSAELPGRFRIVREQGISTGIRRIKAVLD